MTTIAVLGLGAMGSTLASAISHQGEDVRGWNRSPDKGLALRSKGITLELSVADAVEPASVVMLCVLDMVAANSVADAFPDVAGKVVINYTNGTPAEAPRFAERMRNLGARPLVGGIMAIPPTIGTEDALILYSGDRFAFEDCRSILSPLAQAQFLGEDPGLATLNDLALLSGMYGLFSGVLHGFAMLHASGHAASEFLALLRAFLTAISNSLDDMAAQVDSGDYASGVVSNIGMQSIAVQNIIAASEELSLHPELISPIMKLMKARIARGHGGEDVSGVIAELLV